MAPAFGPWVMEQVPNKKALSFLKVHAAADEDHIEKASIILETLTPEQRDLAYSNFEMTASSYRQMLLAIKGLTEAA
ncbi:MAG: hypothetical protein EOP06_29325 [Proteobacteria bacterium]|nr:MAG: hypothetical protein EOP06_29325 [Pseudomonadota bacterium]